MGRLRPAFATLSRRELETIWLMFQRYRGLRPGSCPFFRGEKMFDELHSAGVYHAEVAASLLGHPQYRDLLRKVTGEQI